VNNNRIFYGGAEEEEGRRGSWKQRQLICTERKGEFEQDFAAGQTRRSKQWTIT